MMLEANLQPLDSATAQLPAAQLAPSTEVSIDYFSSLSARAIRAIIMDRGVPTTAPEVRKLMWDAALLAQATWIVEAE